MKRSQLLALAIVVLCITVTGLQAHAAGQATITLDPTTSYQTISGWEATAQAGQIGCPGFAAYKDTLFDRAVNELGLTRLRVELRNGSENPTDYFAKYLAGQIGESAWMGHWSETINDNNDPNSINSAGFHFSELDNEIDTVALPLRQRLTARGEKLSVTLTVVAFSPTGTLDYRTNPAEYGELILAAFQHLQSRYGWVPDRVEVVLEPDQAGWGTGTAVGQALTAAGARLAAAGFHPRFIAPSTTSMANAVAFFDQLIQVPGVRSYLGEVGYHRYTGVSDSTLQALAQRAVQYGVDTAMLEHIGSGAADLQQDLGLGRNSAWQQYVLAFCTGDDGAQYYWIDGTASAPAIHLSSSAKLLRQYFIYVRPGAVRFGASSSDAGLDPLAFRNANGRQVVVVKATTAASFNLRGLAAGTYGVSYATDGGATGSAAETTIAAGQPLAASIPASGVITIFGKDGGLTPTATATPTRTATPKPTATPTPYTKRVDLGGSGYTDAAGCRWGWDRPFAADLWGYVGGYTTTTSMPIAHTSDPALFATARQWSTSAQPGYKLTVANGQYDVTLGFAETQYAATGKRIFDVRVAGSPCLVDFDIYKEAGAYSAISKICRATVTDGLLRIAFIRKVGNPLFSSVQVKRLP